MGDDELLCEFCHDRPTTTDVTMRYTGTTLHFAFCDQCREEIVNFVHHTGVGEYARGWGDASAVLSDAVLRTFQTTQMGDYLASRWPKNEARPNA